MQSHTNQSVSDETFTWTGPPSPAVNMTYKKRRENGQLLLMNVAGS